MPELPEVETIRQGLEAHTTGKEVISANADDSRLFRNNSSGSEAVLNLVSNRTITGWERRGKFMWMGLSDTDEVLVTHLGMSGQVLYDSHEKASPQKHVHLQLTLADGSSLRFKDPRTFGHLTVSKLIQAQPQPQPRTQRRLIPEILAHIGPDPLEGAWDSNVSWEKLRSSTRKVKMVLLDQQVVSGIGNIYADEALFRSGIHGLRELRSLELAQWETLIGNAAAVMREALAQGGTSFDAQYVDAEGNPGYFARSLDVYGRKGQPCVKCAGMLSRVVIGGRSHFYCSTCQR